MTARTLSWRADMMAYFSHRDRQSARKKWRLAPGAQTDAKALFQLRMNTDSLSACSSVAKNLCGLCVRFSGKSERKDPGNDAKEVGVRNPAEETCATRI